VFRPPIATLSLLVACSAPAGPQSAVPPAAPPSAATPSSASARDVRGDIVRDAERQLAARRSSSYAHDTHVDEARGVFEYDCSGFVNYTLKAVAATPFTEVSELRTRPNARTYHDFFRATPKSSSHWRAVERATEIQRGDLIVWLEPQDVDSTNTGHIVIAVATPAVDPAKTHLSVDVIDSARSGHGSTDTRAKGESGLGKGPIVLELDPTGKPRAFRWSPEKSSRPHEVSIAIGRIVEDAR
jgi:hypothetical protein